MYLVTGGGGFIGAHLVRALVRRGERVRVLDNGSSGGPHRIADVLADVEWIAGDVRDLPTVRRACAGVGVILHHAAIASVPRSVAAPDESHATNLTGTLHVLLAARDAGVRRVVFASSSAVYGNLATTPLSEALPTRPLSPYGAQKLAAEDYCRVWHALFGLETVALRYFNVFGPGQNPAGDYAAVIPRFIAAALRGERPTIFGDGEQSRDFIFIRDVVDANLRAATAPEAAGVVLNVGTGASTTLNRLVAELGKILGREVRPIHEAGRPGDVRASEADIALLRATLGFAPSIPFAEGLAATVRALGDAAEPTLG